MHPAINSITVVVILLASDLSEQSRAFPGDAEPSVSGPCSSTKEKDGARAGQQRHRCAMLPRAHVHLSEAPAPGAGDSPGS